MNPQAGAAPQCMDELYDINRCGSNLYNCGSCCIWDPFWKMLLFFVAGTLLEIVFECCIMVWLYTNETLSEKVLKILGWGIKAFLIAITLVIILYFRKEGISIRGSGCFFDNHKYCR